MSDPDTLPPRLETGRAWHATLSGALRDEAVESARSIGQALLQRSLAQSQPVGGVGHREPSSLSQGRAGVALFLHYLDRQCPGEGFGAAGEELLSTALDQLSMEMTSASLYGGFPGIAWAAAHVERMRDGNAEWDLSEIDSLILRYVERRPWRDDYDLIIGLVGLGVYSLQRLPAEAARQTLNHIVERLDEMAEPTSDGVAWFHRPSMLVPDVRRHHPNGWYNVGVAHGIPGVIGLLARIVAAGVANARARELLDGAVRWVMSQVLPQDAASCLPAIVTPGREPRSSRAAWCYGDPGVAVVLLHAARAAGRLDWEADALRIARHAALRTDGGAGVVDPSLCHGSAGLMHLFARLAGATHDLTLKRAAVHWAERTLAMRDEATGIAGYWYLDLAPNGAWVRTVEPGLLVGASGVGLALLGAATNLEPSWDAMLLADVAPTACA